MAAANSCFVVSSTVNAVHSSLPFLTALGEEARRTNSSTVAVLLTSSGDLGSLFDLYFRSLSWGFLIVLLFIIVILITSLFLTAVYYCCFKNAESADQRQLPTADNKHRCRKWSCGVVTIVCGLCCLVILGLGFWLESSLNAVLLRHASPPSINNENIRHWMVLAVLLIASLLMLFTTCGLLGLIFRQWAKCFIVMLVSWFVVVVLIAPISGVGLSILSYTSAFCEEFAIFPNCSSSITLAWSEICTSAFQNGFILVILGCVLVLFISLGQCSGAVFSHLCLSHSTRLTQVDSSPDDFGSRNTLDGSSVVNRHVPTAPPQAVPPTGAFVADRYLTSDQTSSAANVPRRRQTLPAMPVSPEREPPPTYNDAWLSQSVQVTGTQELANPSSSDPARPATTNNPSTSDSTRPRTDNNPTEQNTSL